MKAESMMIGFKELELLYIQKQGGICSSSNPYICN